ncbi:hypothetical protein [Streptosporangium fragile]|uniref:hypothetical protein n=1 Tax=Streptosporangium fragile TaxID=46186 RepID=UPI0031F0BBA0
MLIKVPLSVVWPADGRADRQTTAYGIGALLHLGDGGQDAVAERRDPSSGAPSRLG